MDVRIKGVGYEPTPLSPKGLRSYRTKERAKKMGPI